MQEKVGLSDKGRAKSRLSDCQPIKVATYFPIPYRPETPNFLNAAA